MKANVAIPRWYFEVLNKSYFCNICGPPIELAHFRAPIKVNVAIFRWVGHTDTHLLVGHFYNRIKPLAADHFKNCKFVKRKLESFSYHLGLHMSMQLTGCWGLNISGSMQNINLVDRHNFYPKTEEFLLSSLLFSFFFIVNFCLFSFLLSLLWSLLRAPTWHDPLVHREYNPFQHHHDTSS